MGRALLPICIHPSAAPGALQLGETHTGLPRPLGLWDKEGGACPRAPRFQELKYLCENGTWFHSSGRKTAQASGAGKGVLGHSVPQMAARPLWASFDKSIGLINLHQPSRIQASRRPGMATCHPPPPTALASQPGTPTPPSQTDPATWRGRSAPRAPTSLATSLSTLLTHKGPWGGAAARPAVPITHHSASPPAQSPPRPAPSTTCLPGPGA